MNVDAERTRSLWMDAYTPVDAPALDRDEHCDIAVVGAGIAGLSTAYECAAQGRSVVVIDRGPIATGMTARTTAHLASDTDDSFTDLIETRGLDEARAWYESQAAAIDRIEEIARAEAIACDFARVPAYLFAPAEADASILQGELDAARRVGMRVDWATEPPLAGVAADRSLRFENQARLHPMKYLLGLVDALRQRGVRFYAETAAMQAEEDERGVTVQTALRHTLHAQHAVFATNSPTNDRVAIHSKQAPYRSYAIAGAVPRDAVPDALIWDTLDPYHYVRLQPKDAASHWLIVGGEDHRSGEADDMEARFAALEEWTRRYVPQFQNATHRWSGQVMEPVDGVGFIGRNPGSERTYVITGDSGQGITSGVVGGLLVSSLIARGESTWQALYEPSRKPRKALGEFVRENLPNVKNFGEYVTGGEVASADALAPGDGAIIRQGLKKIAAYRDEQGALHLLSAACTHLNCIVHWNPLEHCWDCPCHGSQFAPDGAVLNGPAISPLERVQG